MTELALPDTRTSEVDLRVVLVAVALLLLLPLGFSSRQRPHSERIGLPRVHSGDEPHYMIILNSLVRDYDFDLANNYSDVHQGSEQAGLIFRGKALDHHTAWRLDGKYIPWRKVFEMDGAKWNRDRRDHPVPRLAKGVSPSLLPPHEYSSHWPGLPLLLAPLLFPLAGTTYLEPAAILCTWLATVLAMLAFVSLARSLGASANNTSLAVLLTFLATPLWHYGRTFFTEPYAVACILGAYALYVGHRRAFLAGVLCAVGMLLKNTFAVIALPLGISMILRRRWKDAAWFATPAVVSVAVNVMFNHAFFGSFSTGPQLFESGDPVSGTVGMLFSTDHGLLLFAPIVVSGMLGWPALYRARRDDAVTMACSFFGLFVLTAYSSNWHGGYCYGSRYLVPVIPFVMLGVLFRLQARPVRPWHYVDIVVLGLLSLWINFQGAVPYWTFFSRHPLGYLFQ